MKKQSGKSIEDYFKEMGKEKVKTISTAKKSEVSNTTGIKKAKTIAEYCAEMEE